jgi:hypothetical protein
MAEDPDNSDSSMDKEPHASQQSAESQKGDSPVETSKIVNSIKDPKPATEQQLNEVKRDMSAFERSTIRWTRTTAGIGFVTAIFICLQWCEMRSGGTDTHDLAVAAGKQADAAKILAEQAKVQTGKMSESLEKATEQAIATNNLAKQAKRSADIARDAFKASNRPYVGIGTIMIKYLSTDVSGVITFYDRPVRQAINMDFTIETKNYGTVPALDFQGEWKVWFDGIEVPGSKVADRPSTLFPGQSIFTPDQIGTDKYADMIASRKILEFEANISYRDASARYSECSRHRFAPNVNGFMDLGACGEPRQNTKHQNPN